MYTHTLIHIWTIQDKEMVREMHKITRNTVKYEGEYEKIRINVL